MGSAARSGTTQRLSSASIKSLPSSPKSTAWLCVQRVYRLARKGRELEIAAKPVRIDRLLLTAYDWPRLALAVECSTGTFIRAIGRDLAAALGTTAVMEGLVRTAVGPFTQPGVALPDALLDTAIRGGLIEPPAVAGPGSPAPAAVKASPSAAIAACDEAGELVGILQPHSSGALRLRPNFRGAG